jgi:hypothetical protein
MTSATTSVRTAFPPHCNGPGRQQGGAQGEAQVALQATPGFADPCLGRERGFDLAEVTRALAERAP